MKKIIGVNLVILLAFCVAIIGVSAEPSDPTTECNTYCNGASPVAKWDWEDGNYVEKLGARDPNYVTTVTGNETMAYWTSNPAVDCVIEKESTDHTVYASGTSGTVSKHDHDISHVTLCANGSTIPEFNLIAAGIAIIGSGIGFVTLRKRR